MCPFSVKDRRQTDSEITVTEPQCNILPAPLGKNVSLVFLRLFQSLLTMNTTVGG